MGVEVLIPDFNGDDGPLRTVMEAGPDILNHNVETVERLQKPVRKRARYHRSLDVLARAKAFAAGVHRPPGHRPHQVEPDGRPGRDARGAVADLPRPARRGLRHPDHRPVPATVEAHLPVERYVHPDEFAEMKVEALDARLQARRVGAARPLQLPRPRPGPAAPSSSERAARRPSTPRAGSSRSRADRWRAERQAARRPIDARGIVPWSAHHRRVSARVSANGR